MSARSETWVDWSYPTSIKVGVGRSTELPLWCGTLGMKHPLLVTDSWLATTPLVGEALDRLGSSGTRCGLFHGIKCNPTGRNVEAGARAFRDGGHDGVIAFGGGSAIDAAKAVAMLVGQSRPLWDFEMGGGNHLRVNTGTMAPVVAVPTTAGTGSEVGRTSVITDEASRVKRPIFHPRMTPGVAILDAGLTVGLPAHLTAATGMDAFTHLIEAFCTTMYHPMAVGIAAEGLRIVKGALPRAFADGTDLRARQDMLVASAMGAAAFQRGLGAVHALAQPLGALYDSHHGLLNAILLPYVLKANRAAIGDQLTALAQILDLPGAGLTAVLDWLLGFESRLGIPASLAEIGIDDEQADLVGQMATEDCCSATNPAALGKADYVGLFRDAVHGRL